MKSTFLIVGFAIVLLCTSCATVYQTEQTPDDLYHSPSIVTPKEKDIIAKNQDNDARYEEYVSSSDDRYLRMKVANRNRWDAIDDYSYWNDSRFNFYGYNYSNNFYGNGYYNNMSFYTGFSFGFNNFYTYGYNPYSFGYSSYYNPRYNYYGGFYNPYNYGSSYTLDKNNAGPRRYSGGSNVVAYRNNNYNNSNTTRPSRSNATNNNSFGNLIRRVIAPPRNSPSGTPSTSVDRPARTFSPSTTPTSNTGGSSGGFGSTGNSSSVPRHPRG